MHFVFWSPESWLDKGGDTACIVRSAGENKELSYIDKRKGKEERVLGTSEVAALDWFLLSAIEKPRISDAAAQAQDTHTLAG